MNKITRTSLRGPKRIMQVMVLGDPSSTYLILGVVSLMACGMLLWPGDTFANPTYAVMRKFGPEWWWATLYGVSGVAMFGQLMYPVRGGLVPILSGLLVCVMWTTSTLAIVLATYPPLSAMSAEVTVAMIAWWHLARLLAEGVQCGRPRN